MNLTHRPCAPSDRDACIALFLANVPRYFHPDELPDFITHLDGHQGLNLVVLAGGERVGFGGFSLGDDGQVASLCWGMVGPGFHGQRIGSYLLLARLHAVTTRNTATHVRLATTPFTEGFFQRHGFETRSIRPDRIAPGLSEVEMTLRLTQRRRARIEARWREIAA